MTCNVYLVGYTDPDLITVTGFTPDGSYIGSGSHTVAGINRVTTVLEYGQGLVVVGYTSPIAANANTTFTMVKFQGDLTQDMPVVSSVYPQFISAVKSQVYKISAEYMYQALVMDKNDGVNNQVVLSRYSMANSSRDMNWAASILVPKANLVPDFMVSGTDGSRVVTVRILLDASNYQYRVDVSG